MMGMGTAALVVSACAAPAAAPAQEGGTEGATAPTQDQILLRIQTNPEYEQAVGDLFIQEHPEVALEYVSVTGIDHEEIASKILSMVAAGQPLNLGFACTEATQLYAGQGLSENLDDYVKRDAEDLKEYFADVSPTLIEAMLFEGSIYQLAQNFNAANMYYNTGVFADAGIEPPASDWTKDDFYEIAKALTKEDANGETEIFGYAWTNRLWGSWMPWIFVNNGNILTEERAPGGEWFWETFYPDDPAAEGRGGGWRWLAPKANDPANVEALEFMVQLTQEGIAPTPELGGGATLQGFFTGGKLAMTPAGGFWAGGLHNAGMTPDSFDAQLWPKWESQRHQFGVCAKFLFTQSDNKDLGWEYLKHEVSKEAMAVHGYFADGYITTPSRRSMCTAEAFAETGPANWEIFYGTLDQHPDTAPIPAPPVSNPMTTIFTTYTARAMTGELTAQAALDGMQAELEELYERNPDQYPASS
jgi:ABC-type glycerol-3-phosphate transport system substrate-binding protein